MIKSSEEIGVRYMQEWEERVYEIKEAEARGETRGEERGIDTSISSDLKEGLRPKIRVINRAGK